MADNGTPTKFPMPEASWSTLKKIIRAYYAKRGNSEVTVEEVAEAADLHRPQVSANNNFLRSLGVLEQESNRLTQTGSELALGITRNDLYTMREALKKLILNCAPIKRLVEIVEARGQVEIEALNTQLYLALNVDSGDRRARWSGTILELLVESALVKVNGNFVRCSTDSAGLHQLKPQERKKDHAEEKVEVSPSDKPGSKLRRIPIPVSPNLPFWYIETPENPSQEEIEKFLQMQRLVFNVKQ